MTFSSFIVVIFIAFILAAIGMFYVRKTHANTQLTREKRQQLKQRIESLNLPRMLQALGIGFGGYFYKTPLEKIDEAADNCDVCTSIDECNEKLRIPELNPNDIEFCANKEHLSEFSRARRIQG